MHKPTWIAIPCQFYVSQCHAMLRMSVIFVLVTILYSDWHASGTTAMLPLGDDTMLIRWLVACYLMELYRWNNSNVKLPCLLAYVWPMFTSLCKTDLPIIIAISPCLPLLTSNINGAGKMVWRLKLKTSAVVMSQVRASHDTNITTAIDPHCQPPLQLHCRHSDGIEWLLLFDLSLKPSDWRSLGSS